MSEKITNDGAAAIVGRKHICCCRNSNGCADYFAAIVQLPDSESSWEGAGYDAVEDEALQRGYEEPFVTADEGDPLFLVMAAQIDWSEVPTI